MAGYAWLIPLLGVAAFALIVFPGRLFGAGHPLGRALLAILAGALAFILFWPVLADLLANGARTFELRWLSVSQTYELALSLIVDNLSVYMLGIVSFLALAIQVYALGYMRGEPRYAWFFAVISLFTAAMLGIVLSGNLLLTYICWELVGLCSFLLIGFYYDRPSAAEAAKKAFITTRIGDVGFLIGILYLFVNTGTFDISEVLRQVEEGRLAEGTVTLAALLIFAGAVGKSGQFPLHVWLPDAMEGPTPVSALIHAATMVAAGVYLVARMYPLFHASPTALAIVTLIGTFTAIFAATMALVERDIKRVLAYSTVSQLGYMFLALGVGGYTAALFHLGTHAFFKALLFLAAGSVIHAAHEQDVYKLGGLARKLPITAGTFVIGALSLAGLPPLAGFWSKDEILNSAFAGAAYTPFMVGLITAVLTAFYMGRVCWQVLFGPPSHAAAPGGYHAHESPPIMTVPLIVLAVFALFAGFVALPVFGGGIGNFLVPPVAEEHHETFNAFVIVCSMLAALVGIGLAWLLYGRRRSSPEREERLYGPAYWVLINRWGMDMLYQLLIDRGVLTLSAFIALFDRKVVNDTGVDGPGKLTVMAGGLLRQHVTGRLSNYALAMAVGAAVLVGLLGLVVFRQ